MRNSPPVRYNEAIFGIKMLNAKCLNSIFQCFRTQVPKLSYAAQCTMWTRSRPPLTNQRKRLRRRNNVLASAREAGGRVIHKHNLSRSRITSAKVQGRSCSFSPSSQLRQDWRYSISALCAIRPSAVHGLVLSSSPRIINVFHASLVAVPILLHSNYAADALRGHMHKRHTPKM